MFISLWFPHSQNSKLSALTAVVPDIPGFRKILPRSEYIIIPKSTLQEDRSCPQQPKWKSPVLDELNKVYNGQQSLDSAMANIQNIIDTETAKKLAGD